MTNAERQIQMKELISLLDLNLLPYFHNSNIIAHGTVLKFYGYIHITIGSMKTKQSCIILYT